MVNLSIFAENNDAVVAINSTSSYPDDLLGNLSDRHAG